MVKSCVFFAVRTEFLNIIYTSFGFKGLIDSTSVFCSQYIYVFRMILTVSNYYFLKQR
jgi:hypothetical protein